MESFVIRTRQADCSTKLESSVHKSTYYALIRRLVYYRLRISINDVNQLWNLALTSSPFRALDIIAILPPTYANPIPSIPTIIPGKIMLQYFSGLSARANKIAPVHMKTWPRSKRIRIGMYGAIFPVVEEEKRPAMPIGIQYTDEARGDHPKSSWKTWTSWISAPYKNQ